MKRAVASLALAGCLALFGIVGAAAPAAAQPCFGNPCVPIRMYRPPPPPEPPKPRLAGDIFMDRLCRGDSVTICGLSSWIYAALRRYLELQR